MKRGAAVGIATVVWFAVAATVLAYFGVGGFRFGFLACAAVLAVGPIVLLVHPSTRGSNRLLWALAASILSLTVSAKLVDLAPASAGVLTAELDGLHLPVYRATATIRSGSSRCRPQCPTVTRQYFGPQVVDFVATNAVVLELHRRNLITSAALRHDLRTPTFRAQARRRIIAVRAARRDTASPVTLTITFTARR